MFLGCAKSLFSPLKAQRSVTFASAFISLCVAIGGSADVMATPFQASSAKVAAPSYKPISAAPDAKIVGGSVASRLDYPFMAALVPAEIDSLFAFCGGSYIGDYYVLTAAHCVYGESPENIDVWIGGEDLSQPNQGQRVRVHAIYVHEDYSQSGFDNDIAVLELETKVSGISPVALASSEFDESIAEGQLFTAIGWGARSDPEDENPLDPIDQLLEVQLPRYNREACEVYYDVYFDHPNSLAANMLCAGRVEGGADTCFGDSGGPLLFPDSGNWTLTGLTSFGDGCAKPGTPGIYTRVSQYVEWINHKSLGLSLTASQDLGTIISGDLAMGVLSLRNISDSPISLGVINIINTQNARDVIIDSSACSTLLEANSACEITVSFIASNIGDGELELMLNANVMGAGYSAPAIIRFSVLGETAIDFSSALGLEGESVSWLVGGSAFWDLQSVTSEGGEAAVSGTIADGERSILQFNNADTSIIGLNFSYFVSSEADFDYLYVYLNDHLVFAGSGTDQNDFANTTVTLPPNDSSAYVATVRFEYVKDGAIADGEDQAIIDSLTLIKRSEVINSGIGGYALPSAINFSAALGLGSESVEWYVGGANWVLQNEHALSGAAAASGNAVDGESATLVMRIKDASVIGLRFNYLVSSEEDFDYLNVYVNGALVFSASGNNEPLKYSVESLSFTGSANTTIVFEYAKDGSYSEGLDQALIDNLTLVRSTATAPVNNFASNGGGGGGSVNFLMLLLSGLLALRMVAVSKSRVVDAR